MVTLHEVITFLVSMPISISRLQTQTIKRCVRSRHLAQMLSLRRKRSSTIVFEMAASETITSIILIKLIRVSLGTVRHPLLFFLYCYGVHRDLHSFPTRRSSDLARGSKEASASPSSGGTPPPARRRRAAGRPHRPAGP